MSVVEWIFGVPSSTSRGTAMAWRADWVTLHGLSDALIAASFFVIALGIVFYLRRRHGLLHEYRVVAWLFGGFILVCGLTHLLGVISIWYPIHGLEGLVKGLTAVLSGAAVGLIWPLFPVLVRLPSSRELADVNHRLRREAEAHEATLRELADAHRELERRVEERTGELQIVNARFKTALRGAKIHLFSQDSDLRYTWASSPEGDAEALLGRTDLELWDENERVSIMTAKRAVMETGEPQDIEVSLVIPQRRGVFALHLDPIIGPDGSIQGVLGAAIDIGRIRSLETEQRRLSEELGAALQRYETALRGSQVRVYTQDRDLRYQSVSGRMFGMEPEAIVGRREDEILPVENRELTAAKRRVIETGEPGQGEFKLSNNDALCWYDMHMEAVRDASGSVVGLTSAAVDVTERKAGEAHLRELMRELTHRSKNLLAVIQAMARQTAHHAGSTERFLEHFSARLQALSASHDLLVQEGWHGASLSELVHSQLGHHLDGDGARVTVRGPSLLLKPEAAQSLGLALHELAANASKYGALSVPEGRVEIEWRRLPESEGGAIEIHWRESGGPDVVAPERNGFGRLVIERNLARSLEADVKLQFDPKGLCCHVIFPG